MYCINNAKVIRHGAAKLLSYKSVEQAMKWLLVTRSPTFGLPQEGWNSITDADVDICLTIEFLLMEVPFVGQTSEYRASGAEDWSVLLLNSNCVTLVAWGKASKIDILSIYLICLYQYIWYICISYSNFCQVSSLCKDTSTFFTTNTSKTFIKSAWKNNKTLDALNSK